MTTNERMSEEQLVIFASIARFHLKSRDESIRLLRHVFVEGMAVIEAAASAGVPLPRAYAQVATTKEKLAKIRRVGMGPGLTIDQFGTAAELAAIRPDHPTIVVLADVFVRAMSPYRAALDRGMHPANASSAVSRFRKILTAIFDFNNLDASHPTNGHQDE